MLNQYNIKLKLNTRIEPILIVQIFYKKSAKIAVALAVPFFPIEYAYRQRGISLVDITFKQ